MEIPLFQTDLLAADEQLRSAGPPLGAILYRNAPSRGSALRFMEAPRMTAVAVGRGAVGCSKPP